MTPGNHSPTVARLPALRHAIPYGATTAVGVLALAGLLGVIGVAWTPGSAAGVLVSIASALLTAAGVLILGALRLGWRAVLLSPLVVIAVILVCIFALRPLSLMVDPRIASQGLLAVEFGWSDLTRTVGLGSLGFGLFGLAFVLAWRRGSVDGSPAPGPPDERRIALGAIAALVVGTLLWGALFIRNGGFGALIDDPASLHLGQFSGGYGTVGQTMCLGAALLAMWAWLRRPTRALGWTVVAAATVSVAGSFALQTRGPLVATIVAAVVVLASQRRISGRMVVALCAAGLLVVLGLFYMRSVREYAQTEPLSDAVTAALTSDPLQITVGEFTDIDNFVILTRLVPDGVDPLSGSSLADVPAAFVPRALWGEKPLPLDFKLSRIVYGEGARAGTPFTLAGELFWNFGVSGVLVGMALLGGLAGLAWGTLAARRTPTAGVAASLVVGYSYLVLTRPLGAMFLTLAMALVGLTISAWMMGYLGVELRGGLRAPWRAQGKHRLGN